MAALAPALEPATNFRELVLAAIAADVGRGGETNPPTDPAIIFADMLERLETDPLWAQEYVAFVAAVRLRRHTRASLFLTPSTLCGA